MRLNDVVRAVRGHATEVTESTMTEAGRTGGDIPVDVRREIVTACRIETTDGERFPNGAMARLVNMFRRYHVSESSIRRLWASFRRQRAQGVSPLEMSFAAKRVGRSATNTKLTPAIARKLVELNDASFGVLSNKKLASKLCEEVGGRVAPDTVRRWCKALGAVKRRRYIKPLLTPKHKLDRLSWVSSQVPGGTSFPDFYDTVHVDEKWFYLMRDGSSCRIFPDDDGTIRMPPPPRLHHKRHVPKLMFLCAVARPRPEYNFDGKIGIWFFAVDRKAKRSNKKTGTVAGVTDVLESLTVNAEEYRKTMCGSHGVFAKIREKMPWMRGKTLWLQHDGAGAHTAKKNDAIWESEGRKDGFDIVVVVQPAQSPDLNVNDLAFFNSLQSDVRCVAKSTMFDLREAVLECWEAYPPERLDSCWRCLIASYRDILKSHGDNDSAAHPR